MTPEVMTERKVKAGLYLSESFYYKVRIWLMSRRPRIAFSEYAEIAIRERFDRDNAVTPEPTEVKKKAP